MRTIAIAILAVAMGISGCKKERINIDTRPAPSPQKQIRLSKIKRTNNAQYWEHSFVYNSEGYLVAHNTVWKSYGQFVSATGVTYEYDTENRLAKEITRQDGEPEFTGTYTYSGDTLRRIDYMEGNELQFYILYQSYNGKITGKSWYRADGDMTRSDNLRYDMYGNLVEIESYFYQGGYNSYRVDDILHDDKPNCFRTIKGPVDISFLNGFEPQVWSANNVTSFESEQDSFGERTIVHLLEYNKYNYLSKLSRYDGREVFEYEYEEY